MTEKRLFQLEQWKSNINEKIQSGLNVTEWCKENGYTKSKYYYWLREIQKESIDEALGSLPVPVQQQAPAFVEITRPEPSSAQESPALVESSAQPAAVIRNNHMQIELFSNAPSDIVREIMKAVNHV